MDDASVMQVGHAGCNLYCDREHGRHVCRGPLGQDRNHCLPTASCAQEEVLMLSTNRKTPLS